MRTGAVSLPLHYGKTPRWLFQRMARLARQVAVVIVEEFGPEEMLHRLADPFWFQAFGCVLGFDWHSSGLTTTACGALKQGIKGLEKELGVFVVGGKGAVSRQVPFEIERIGDLTSLNPGPLVYASRMAAKVDNTALQDGYQIYHHCFIFTPKGLWGVVQQGMDVATRYARRYHWLSEGVKDFVCEPHTAICCDQKGSPLNMVAAESEGARGMATSLSHERPDRLVSELKKLQNLKLPSPHQVQLQDIHPDRLARIFLRTYEHHPGKFEELLSIEGVGPKTVRALCLISEIIYGASLSFRDPVRFSFAHGGKDGHPYPVDRENYDRSIEILRRAITSAKIGNRDKLEALRRLGLWVES